MTNSKISKIEYLVLILYSIVIKFFMSIYSIRFSEIFTDNDGAIYYVVGKAIMSGKVLYKDIFDHKTPYVFFANAVASIFEKNHIGLFILEIIILFSTLLFTYKFLQFFTTKFRSLVGTFILGILLNVPQITFSYSRTEEYAIAFMMIALYLFTKYYFLNVNDSAMTSRELSIRNSDNKNEVHNNLNAKEFTLPMIIIGIMAGLTFMTNIRAIVLFVPFAIMVLIKNLKQKKYLYIIKLFFAGLLGVFLSILPYIIYMFATDSVSDAFYAIYTFNVNYLNSAMDSSIDILSQSILFLKEQAIVYIFVLLSFIALCILKFDKYLKISIIASYIIAFIYITFSKRAYPYYLVIFMPYFLSLYFVILSFIDKTYRRESIKNVNSDYQDKTFATKAVYVIIAFCAFVLFGILISYKGLSNRYKNNTFRASRINAVIESKFTNKKDLNVLSFGFMPEVYVFTHTIPKYKYFMIPNVSYKVDKTPYMAQYDYIMSMEPDIIVFKSQGFYDSYPQNVFSQINSILSEAYTLEDTIRTNEFEGDIYIFAKKL